MDREKLNEMVLTIAASICVNAERNGHKFDDPEKIIGTSLSIVKEILLPSSPANKYGFLSIMERTTTPPAASEEAHE